MTNSGGIMAKCELCGKVHQQGFKISHSYQGFKRTFQPNLHKTKVKIKGRVKTVMLCTKCLRSGKMPKA